MTHTTRSSLTTLFYFVIITFVFGGFIAFFQSGPYFQILTPAIFALSCSFMVAFIIWRTNLHHLPNIIALCTLLAIGIYATNFVATYLILKIEASDGLRSLNNFDDFLLDTTGKTGVAGYIDLAMETGIQTRDTYNMVPRTQATGREVLLYWAFDFALILAGCLWGGWMAYRRPYAENYARYYGFIALSNELNNVERIGALKRENLAEFLNQIKGNNFEQAGSLIEETGDHYVSLERGKLWKDGPMNVLITPAELLNSATRVIHRQQVTRQEMKRFLTFTGIRRLEAINPDETKWFVSVFGILFVIQIITALALRFIDVF